MCSSDLGRLRAGRLVVFAPGPSVVYPDGEPGVHLDPGPMATVLEGAVHPTHFAGVLQVVLTLMHLIGPRWAVFGRKDTQQLAIVSAMVRNLAVPMEIVPVDIRREPDGLAMSSRNSYLSPEHAVAAGVDVQVGLDLGAAGDRAGQGGVVGGGGQGLLGGRGGGGRGRSLGHGAILMAVPARPGFINGKQRGY